MDEDRFDTFIRYWRAKCELFAGIDDEEEHHLGMELALVDAEMFRDATPEWVASVMQDVP